MSRYTGNAGIAFRRRQGMWRNSILCRSWGSSRTKLPGYWSRVWMLGRQVMAPRPRVPGTLNVIERWTTTPSIHAFCSSPLTKQFLNYQFGVQFFIHRRRLCCRKQNALAGLNDVMTHTIVLWPITPEVVTAGGSLVVPVWLPRGSKGLRDSWPS